MQSLISAMLKLDTTMAAARIHDMADRDELLIDSLARRSSSIPGYEGKVHRAE